MGICSALEKQHIDQAWETIRLIANGPRTRNITKPTPRAKPLLVSSDDKSPFEDDFYSQHHSQIAQLEQEVMEAKLSPSQALEQLFQ